MELNFTKKVSNEKNNNAQLFNPLSYQVNFNDEISQFQNENKDLIENNQRSIEKIQKLEYNMKVKILFDNQYLVNSEFVNNIQDHFDFLRKENNEKNKKYLNLINENIKVSIKINAMEKSLLILPQSKLTSIINVNKQAIDLSNQRRCPSYIISNNSDIKILSEFFNATVVYSINQKENENYKNKILLEKVMLLCQKLNLKL